jgi:hypothetical protein
LPQLGDEIARVEVEPRQPAGGDHHRRQAPNGADQTLRHQRPDAPAGQCHGKRDQPTDHSRGGVAQGELLELEGVAQDSFVNRARGVEQADRCEQGHHAAQFGRAEHLGEHRCGGDKCERQHRAADQASEEAGVHGARLQFPALDEDFGDAATTDEVQQVDHRGGDGDDPECLRAERARQGDEHEQLEQRLPRRAAHTPGHAADHAAARHRTPRIRKDRHVFMRAGVGRPPEGRTDRSGRDRTYSRAQHGSR